MDKPISKNTARRPLAKEGLLPALVERLTERGIIRPEEAEDMLALLTAFSDDAEPLDSNGATGATRPSNGLFTGRAATAHTPGSGTPPGRSW